MYELTIDVQIQQQDRSSDRLHVRESVILDVKGFLDICKILSLFHDLAESLRKGNSQSNVKSL